MLKFAFISRHQPTPEQYKLAADAGVNLVHIGDRDAFSVDYSEIASHPEAPFYGVVVVHPAAAMRLAHRYSIGVFENANRAAPGEPVKFTAVGFHVYEALR